MAPRNMRKAPIPVAVYPDPGLLASLINDSMAFAAWVPTRCSICVAISPSAACSPEDETCKSDSD